nr:hypothetical protein [Rhodococcus sp. 06-418-1B]
MNRGSVALAAALRASGYPAPTAAAEPEQSILSWGSGPGAPELKVTDAGQVTVTAAHAPDAVFTLSPERQSADDWIALLHPLIAEAIAEATDTEPVPTPTKRVDRNAVIVWLDHIEDTGATYAVYTDNARIWVSDTTALDTATALFDTDRGHQLGVTPTMLMPIQSALRGTVMINPNLAYTKAVDRFGSWEPAISFRDTRGFLERATTRLGTHEKSRAAVHDGTFRDFDAPTIELDFTGRGNLTRAADVAGLALVLLHNAQRQHRAEGHHLTAQ